MEEKQMLFMIMQTQQIIVNQLNSIVDVLSKQFGISIEEGTMEVGDE